MRTFVVLFALLLLASASAQAAPRGPVLRCGRKQVARRVVAMTRHLNGAGNVFGGWLLAQMDQAASGVAVRRARGRCVTAALDSMTFKQPVKLNDELSIYTKLERVGRSSMTLFVEAYRRDRSGGKQEKVTEGRFTYVAVDKRGRPRPVDESKLGAVVRHVVRPPKRLFRALSKALLVRRRASQSPPGEQHVRVRTNVAASGSDIAGWLLSQMDIAAGTTARQRAGDSVTIGVTGMSFAKPIKPQDEISLYSKLERVGRSSMKIHVEAWRRPRTGDVQQKVTEGTFTFVAVDKQGNKRVIDPQ